MTNPGEKFAPQTYRQEKPDGSSKLRRLWVPNKETRRQHDRMLRLLYSFAIPIPLYVTGSIPGSKLLDNVEPHRQSDHFYMVDLKDAFQNVDIDELIKIITNLEIIGRRRDDDLAPFKILAIPEMYHGEIESFIRESATTPEAPGLPLGAPCSPFLFNLYCIAMDQKLAEHCASRDITYTRYLDDLTFSSEQPVGRKRRQKINSLVEGASGMRINHAKSKVHSLQNGPVTITGISIYPNRRIAAGPGLHETYQTLMDDLLAKLENGLSLTEEETGRLHGYNGALHQMTDGETPTIRQLDRKYQQVLGKVGCQQTVEAGSQLALFGE